MVFASPALDRHPIHEPGGRPNLIWIVFWVDPKEFGSQISIAITAILTLIAYRFAIGANLPNAEYMKHPYLFILGGGHTGIGQPGPSRHHVIPQEVG